MLKRTSVSIFGALFLLLMTRAEAQVTANVNDLYIRSGKSAVNHMFLFSSQGDVDGINGELTFDSSLLMNPSVDPSSGAKGFIAEGNEVTPGVFRFILYKSPADASLDLSSAVLFFRFESVPDLTSSMTSDLSFTMTSSAAARVISAENGEVISIGEQGETVTFNPCTAFINRASARDWHLYQ